MEIMNVLPANMVYKGVIYVYIYIHTYIHTYIYIYMLHMLHVYIYIMMLFFVVVVVLRFANLLQETYIDLCFPCCNIASMFMMFPLMSGRMISN